jgi:RNA polymerase sigma-70 factor (ECF subfamily)
MDDAVLVERLQAGDTGVFEILVRLHYRAVYNMAFRFMGDHGGADDVTQDTFVKAFHAVGGFRGESSFKSWLLRICMNTAKNALRSKGRHEGVDVDGIQLKSIHKDFNRLEQAQTAEILKAAVDQLPPRQRQALELRVFEDLSFKEIAEIMECPFDTAKANYRHAVMGLKKILEHSEKGRNLAEMKQAFESLAEHEEES